MKQLSLWLLTLFLSHLAFLPAQAMAQASLSTASPFPVPAGLEPAIEFWKKIFTQYGLNQLVYFDPLDMSKIYEVVEVGEDSRSNQYIDDERSRIAAANDVDMDRVRAQRGVRERTADGLKRAGRYLAQMQQVFIDRGLPPELTFLAGGRILLRHERPFLRRRPRYVAIHAGHRAKATCASTD